MLVEFLLQNAILSVMVAALGGATIYMWTVVSDKATLEPDLAILAINSKHAQPVDLRPRAEFDKGHVPGARHVDADTAQDKVAALAKKWPVLLICARGTVSAALARKLKAAGTSDPLILKGGMAAWQQDGKPTTRK